MISKKLLSIIAAMALIFSGTYFSVAAEEDTDSDEVDGVISTTGTNNETSLGTAGFDLFDINDTVEKVDPGSSVTPQLNYRIVFNFTDIDELKDIHKVSFKFFNLNRPTSQLEQSFNSYTTTGIQQLDANNPNNPFMLSDDALVIDWTETGGFQLVGSAEDVSWEILETTFTEESSTSFKYIIDFKISKVAMNNEVWYVGAMVEDGKDSDLNEETFFSVGPYTMNWYGEVFVPNDSEVKWENVNAGDGFTVANNTSTVTNRSSGQTVGVNYISNGYFQHRIKSSSDWTAEETFLPVVGSDNKAYLTTKSAQSTFSPQEFGLDISFNYDETDLHTRIDASFDTFRSHLLDIDELNANLWRSRTLEVGRDFDNFVLRVAVADEFQNATYRGVITIGIRDEQEIIPYSTYMSISDSGIITDEDYLGISVRTENELLTLLEDDNVRLPIYLKNGFVEISSNSENLSVLQSNLKPIIGDVFITGDDVTAEDLFILYGDLYIQGDRVQVSDSLLKNHLDETVYVNQNNSDNVNPSKAAPAANLIVSGQQFTGSALTINGDVYVEATGTAYLEGSSTLSTIGKNVYVSSNSELTLTQYNIATPSDRSTSASGYGDIFVTENSQIQLDGDVNFADIFLTESTGSSNLKDSDSPTGFTLTADQGSEFTFNQGTLDSVFVKDESFVTVNAGTINKEIESISSNVIINFGNIGGSGSAYDYGIRLDVTTTALVPASNITISGGTVSNLRARHDAYIYMNGGTIDDYSELSEDVTLQMDGGSIHNLEAYDDVTMTLSDVSAEIRRLYTFNDVVTTVNNGKLGSSADSFISISDHSQLTMNAGTLTLGQMSDSRMDEQIINNGNKEGLLVRDDAVAILGSSVSIAGSFPELEIRDLGSVTVNTTAQFSRVVKDYSVSFNEEDTEFSSVSNARASLVEMFVRPDGGPTNRPTRSGADNPTSIPYDFDYIESSNSAFEEARRLDTDTNGEYYSNVYLTEGEYTQETVNSINLDTPQLKLLYTWDGRNALRGPWNTALTAQEALNASQGTAVLEIPVKISSTNNKVHGIYFDLDGSQILIDGFDENTPTYFTNNYVAQSGGIQPILEVDYLEFEIDGNYLTRNGTTNDSPGVKLIGPFNGSGLSSSPIFESNYLNNLAGDGLYITGSGTNSPIRILDNVISSQTRPVNGRGIVFDSIDIEGVRIKDNTIAYTGDSAVEFDGSTLSGVIEINNNNLSNIQSGHGIYFTSTTTLEENDNGDTLDLDFKFNDIWNFSSSAGYSVFFEDMNEVMNLTLSQEYYRLGNRGLVISGATTISAITVVRGNFNTFSENAFYLEATTIEDLIFTHTESTTNGHRLDTSNTTFPLTGSISDIDETAILISGSSLNGFDFNGFEMNRFALDGDAFAGIDFLVNDLSGLDINQSLIRINRSVGSSYQFNEYQAKQVEFTNGLGPALRFHVSDDHNYTDNTLFNALIQSNAIGIEFAGSLSSSDAIARIFDTFVPIDSSNDLRIGLIDLVEADADYSFTTGESITNIAGAGLQNNVIELLDVTQTIDFDAFRETHNDLEYTNEVDTLFINQIDGANALMRLDFLDQSTLSLAQSIDQLTFTTSQNLTALADIDFYSDDTETSIVGIASENLGETNGLLIFNIDLPAGASGAEVVYETPRNSNLTSPALSIVGDTLEFGVPIATSNGSIWTVLDHNTLYNVSINWLDSSSNLISSVAFQITLNTATMTTDSYITAISDANSGSDIEALLTQSLKGTLNGSVSSAAFYETLYENVQADQPNSFTAFQTLFDELNTYELALENALTYIAGGTGQLTLTDPISTVMIQDVIDALSGTSITRINDGTSASYEAASAFITRLDTLLTDLASIEEERWVREDLLELTIDSYSTFETELRNILNLLDNKQVYDPSRLTLSPSSIVVTTGTSLSTIQGYLNQSGYPLYTPQSGSSEVLEQVTNWDVESGTWNSLNDAEGVYVFTATYEFPSNSDYFFDADRTTSVAVSVTVTTISVNETIDQVSIQRDESTNRTFINLGFYMDDASTYVEGSSVDELDASNGLITLQTYAPSEATSALVTITLNGIGSTQEITKTGNFIPFSVTVATLTGTDWEPLSDETQYDVAFTWKNGSETLYTTPLTLEIDGSNQSPFIDQLNAASSASEIESLFASATIDELENSAVSKSDYLDDYYDNLAASSISTFTASDALFDDLLTYQETLISAVAFSNNITQSTEVNASFYDLLIDDVIDALQANSNITRVHSDTKSATSLISELQTLKTDLSNVSVQSWIAEDYSIYTDVLSEDVSTYHTTLKTRLQVIASSLSSSVIYDSGELTVNPSEMTVSTGTSLSTVLDDLNNTVVEYESTTLSPASGSEWTPSTTWESVNDTFGSTVTFTRAYTLPSNVYANTNRDSEITITVTVNVE